jgi:hypothetical protein
MPFNCPEVVSSHDNEVQPQDVAALDLASKRFPPEVIYRHACTHKRVFDALLANPTMTPEYLTRFAKYLANTRQTRGRRWWTRAIGNRGLPFGRPIQALAVSPHFTPQALEALYAQHSLPSSAHAALVNHPSIDEDHRCLFVLSQLNPNPNPFTLTRSLTATPPLGPLSAGASAANGNQTVLSRSYVKLLSNQALPTSTRAFLVALLPHVQELMDSRTNDGRLRNTRGTRVHSGIDRRNDRKYLAIASPQADQIVAACSGLDDIQLLCELAISCPEMTPRDLLSATTAAAH